MEHMNEPEVGITAVKIIVEALSHYPEVATEQIEKGLLVVASEGGFDVSIVEQGGEQLVSGGGWHDHYSDAVEASAIFLWLLTPSMRIVEKQSKGDTLSARLERFEACKWEDCGSTVCLLQLPFLTKQEVILQNRHILRDPPESKD